MANRLYIDLEMLRLEMAVLSKLSPEERKIPVDMDHKPKWYLPEEMKLERRWEMNPLRRSKTDPD